MRVSAWRVRRRVLGQVAPELRGVRRAGRHVDALPGRAAAQAQLGQPEASGTLEELRVADPGFADAPLEELRRYFFSEATAAAVADGLRLAGLEID